MLPLFLFLLTSTTLYVRMTPTSFDTMNFSTLAPVQPPGDSRGISDRAREMLAYIISPGRYRPPTASELGQLLSSALNKYYAGMVWIMQAAVGMFSGKEARAQVLPISYPLGARSTNVMGDDPANGKAKEPDTGDNVWDSFGIREPRVLPASIASAGSSERVNHGRKIPGDDCLLDLMERGLVASATKSSSLSTSKTTDVDPGSHQRMNESSRGDIIAFEDHSQDARHEPAADPLSSSSEDAQEPEPTNSAAHQSAVEVKALVMPPVAGLGFMHGRQARYSGQNSLSVPGRHPQNRRLPSEAERALHELRYDLDTSYNPELRYTACELADRGIFLHQPRAVKNPHTTAAYPSKAQLRRETAVGPLKRYWSWKGKASGVPRIEISRPDDRNATVTPKSNQGTSARNPAPVDLVATVLSSQVPARRTRGRSNAIRIASTSGPPSTEAMTGAPAQKTVAPVRNDIPPTKPDLALTLVNASPAKTPAAQLARKMRGRPSSMSEWLRQFSTGINPLVDESIIASAGVLGETALESSAPSTAPLLPVFSESSSPLSSPLSSPDSSPPATPIDDYIPLPPLNIVEEKESTPPINARRRARCSYDGAKCDLVVAPTIPEELVTEEVGVAC